MKKKNQKFKNGKQRMSFKKTTELSQKMVEDKKAYNLRVTKKKKNKDEVHESSKAPQRNLRTRTVKNYSETKKVVNSKPEGKEVNKKSSVIITSIKRIPIYKTMELMEEEVKNPDEIYEFVDDLQVSDEKVKKKKKFRKPSVKQIKKFNGMQYKGSQKAKTKPTKTFSKKVQLKEQEKQSMSQPDQNVVRNIYANIKIPEHLQNAGDSTIAEASTIVVSNQGLQQSDRTSPNNSVSFPSNTQESNISNYSLIRESLSPITKEVDNLFIGSPVSSADAFSQIQKVVQSTPQLNRELAGQRKKPLVQMNINSKSIFSEDTVQLSLMDNKKSITQNMADEAQLQKENVSPRKFGTLISNINSVESVTPTLLHQEQQSPQKAVLSPISFENNENDQEMQDDVLSESSILTTDNSLLDKASPNKSSKIKTDQLVNLLRIASVIQSFKQIASSESKLKNLENLRSQKENKSPDSVAGPSNPEKPRAVVLRQSNLNNFLNLDEMPERTRISTAHGIFDDVNNSPINGKKPQTTTILEESNIENEFDLRNSVCNERSSPIKKKSVPIIATARDVARSVKGKLFLKARVKSSLTRRTPENMAKKTLLKNILKKSAPELEVPVNKEIVKQSKVENEKSKNNNNSLMNYENKKNKNLMDTENERKNNFIDAVNERNRSFKEVENERNRSLMEDKSETIASFMEEENEKNAGHMENESETNGGHMEDENEKNAGNTEDESEQSAGHMEDENEKNAGNTEDESEQSAGHMEDENEKNTSLKIIEKTNISLDPTKAYLDSISFSDTFDLLSENGEDSTKVPDDIPLFVDLEPVHFSQPPRRSYSAKAKRAIHYDTSKDDSQSECSEEDDYVKLKKKRKKASRFSKEEKKRMQEWIKSVNETFNEIEQHNLTIE